MTDLSSSNPDLKRKWETAQEILRELGSTIVCFSGGLDSSVVLALAHQTLGPKAIAMTATGPALAAAEKTDAEEFTRKLGAQHVWIDAKEASEPGYIANGPDRCFHCKTALYRTAHAVRVEHGLAAVINGTNTDDLGDYRPGLDAAKSHGVRSPLLEAALSKREVRELARALGLDLWEKPAAACLASRLPYGTAVTPEKLSQVESLESSLKSLGFVGARVRHHDTIARIEVQPEALVKTVDPQIRAAIVTNAKRLGFKYVTVDLEGYRTGSHNEVLAKRLPTLK